MKHSKKPYFVGELMPGLPSRDSEQRNGIGGGKIKETAVKEKSSSRRETSGSGGGEISEAERDYYLAGH